MYKVEFNQLKNQLLIELEGFISKEEAINYRKKSEDILNQIKPGFTFLADLRKLKVLPQESLGEIQKVRELSVIKGVIKGATVVNDLILRMQTRRTANEIEGFEEEYFLDIEEAKAYLNKNS